jgi:hypothetical protein
VPALQALRRHLTQIVLQIANVVRHIAGVLRPIARALRHLAAHGVRFVQRGVPEVDAETAGLFRIVFGLMTLAYFAFPSHRVDASWLNATFDPEIEGPVHAWVLERLRGRPFVVNLLTPWLMTLGIAFVAGIFTRLTYALFVAGVLVWAYVAMSIDSTHPHSALVLTLVALLPSRWGDAWSIDSWLRRIRGRAPLDRRAARRYGYSVWVPALAFGVTFAAAAWAKLSIPPHWTSWILNGTIKYHIISDSATAPVAWGLQLVRHPLLAMFASFGAIAIEALVVTAAFSHNEWYRLAMGFAAAMLFAGIGLFMGIVWPGWWIPLLGFLPWHRVSQRLRPTRSAPAVPPPGAVAAWRALTAAQLLVVAGVVAQQVVVSALAVERAPMFSWYDMYARTYTNPADYNASIPPAYRIFVASDRGRTQLRCSPHEELVRDFQAALEGAAEPRARVWRALRGCGADLSNARSVTFEGNARTFDWNRLEFTSTHAVALGPLAADQDEVTTIAR